MSNNHTAKKYEHEINSEPLWSPFGNVQQEIQHLGRHKFWPSPESTTVGKPYGLWKMN
jgi:hypothetical protein